MANVLPKRLFNNLQFSNKLYRLNQLRNTLCRSFYRQSAKSNRKYDSHLSWFAFAGFAGAFATGVGTIYWLSIKPSKIKTPFLLSAASKEEEEVEEKTDLTLKQMKFEDYASYEYGGKRLMSPKDFLDSLVDNKQDSAKNKKILTTQDINRILKSTKQLSKHREDLFTYVGENGIITYPEYLFLLTLLTKSSHGLHVAFRMLDLDGNETLGRTEFQELEKMLNKKTSAKSLNETANSPETMTLPNTSLLIYFFGVAGNGQLTFNDMLHFTKNLQREFWKREFLLYSASKGVIDGEQFAKLLLQSTQLTDKDIKEYVERLKSRQTAKINVSLQDYVKFGEFLNNLEEFSISLKIYNVANQPVTQEEFKRAVLISTGDVLGDHIVNTVFQLFDIDGDGKLSQKEFLGLMKDRVNKRFTIMEEELDRKLTKPETMFAQLAMTRANNLGFWGGFTNCVKAELVN